MSDLAERIAWILEHRRGPDGARWSASGLSTAANLSSRAHVGMMKRGELANPRSDTLARAARTAGVSLRWLATGEGSPDDRDAALDIQVDRRDAEHVDELAPPSRASAVARALWEAARVVPGTEPEDYDAARAAMADSAQFIEADGDVAGFAVSVLRAAMSLRRDGRPTTTAAILTRVAVGRTFGAEARDEAVEKHLAQRIGAEIARKRRRGPGN